MPTLKKTKRIVYPEGMDEQEVLEQVQSEFMQSLGVVNTKRMQFLEDLRIYNDSRRTKEKVRVNLAFSNCRALKALSISDDMKVKYVGGQEMHNIQKANNWNMLAEDAKHAMGMTKINIEVADNKFKFGVGIKMLDFDGEDITCCSFDTKMWMPDPNGWMSAEYFRFMGFKKFMTKYEMEDLGFQKIAEFRRLRGDEILEWNPYNGLNYNQERSTNLKIREYAVYEHWTIFNGEKYLVTTNDSMTAVARIVKFSELIPTVMKLTLGIKGDVRPCALSYYNPDYQNPYGISVIDLSYDKQIALSKLVNLQIKRAIRISLGGHKFYNKRIIGNKTDLVNLDVEPKLIGLDPGNQPLSNIVYEQPVSVQMPADNQNAQQDLQYRARMGVGMDANQMGAESQGDQTATEANIVQAGANAINQFGNLIDVESEKEFWFKWLLMAKKHYTKKRVITVLNAIGEKIVQFDTDDLDIGDISTVHIKSTYAVRREDMLALNQLQLLIPFAQQIGGFAYRKLLRDIGEKATGDPDRASVYFPYLFEEMEAMEQVPLMNNNEKLDWKVDDIMGEDHMAYIVIYQQSKDTPSRMRGIKNRFDAEKEKQRALRKQEQQAKAAQAQNNSLQQQAQAQAFAGAQQQGQAAGVPANQPAPAMA